MRILTVCDHFPTYGTKSVLSLSQTLAERGHEVCVLSTSVGLEGERLGFSEEWDFCVRRFPSLHIPGVPYSYTPFAPKMMKQVAKEFQPDIVHTHFIMYWLSLSSAELGLSGYPLLLSLHGLTLPNEPSAWPSGMALDFLYLTKGASLVRRATGVLCVSKKVRQKFEWLFPFYSRPTRVIPIGVSPDALDGTVRFGRNEIRSTLDLEGKRVFLFLGRVVQDKGILELLLAFRGLRRRRDDVALLVVGDGSMLEMVKKFSSSIPDVYPLGFQEDVGTYLNAADVFVLPSYREGLPTALLEAMYFGLPFIATQVGGISDVVDCGCRGTIVPPRSVADLEAALQTMACVDASTLKQMGQDNKRIVQESFVWERVVDLLLDFYQGLT